MKLRHISRVVSLLALGLPVLGQDVTLQAVNNPGGQEFQAFPASLQGYGLDFSTMLWNQPGAMQLRVYGEKTFRYFDEERNKPFTYRARTDFLTQAISQNPGLQPGQSAAITREEAIALGVSTATVDAFLMGDAGDPDLTGTRLYKSLVFDSSQVWTPQYRTSGTLIALADIPEAGRWRVSVVNSLGHGKTQILTLPAGPAGFVVSNVDAGNVRFRVETEDTRNYHREEPLVVRGPGTSWGIAPPAFVAVRFVTDAFSAGRYRIKHLSLGQSSQDEKGAMSLYAGRDALVRIMMEDQKGEGFTGTRFASVGRLRLVARSAGGTEWTLHDGVGKLSASAVGTGQDEVGVPNLTIPGTMVQPGLTITATLFAPNGAVADTRVIQPAIQTPSVVKLHLFSVVENGKPQSVLTPDQWAKLWESLYQAFDRFPNFRFELATNAQIFMPNSDLYALWVDPLQKVLEQMNIQAARYAGGWSSGGLLRLVGSHVFLGVAPPSFSLRNAQGWAKFGLPGAAVSMQNVSAEYLGNTIAHEIGHTLGIHHAPSPYADQVDGAYPYSGNGMAAGYSFSAKVRGAIFEDRPLPNWDTMAYASGGIAHEGYWVGNLLDMRFSDYNMGKVFRFTPMAAPTVQDLHLALPKDANGVEVMGSTELQAAQTWLQSLPATPACGLPLGQGGGGGMVTAIPPTALPTEKALVVRTVE